MANNVYCKSGCRTRLVFLKDNGRWRPVAANEVSSDETEFNSNIHCDHRDVCPKRTGLTQKQLQDKITEIYNP